jgi:hypothetical protein
LTRAHRGSCTGRNKGNSRSWTDQIRRDEYDCVVVVIILVVVVVDFVFKSLFVDVSVGIGFFLLQIVHGLRSRSSGGRRGCGNR